MSNPVSSFNVTTPSTTSPTSVPAQTFNIQTDGSAVFYSPNGQTVAAFAAGAWTQIQPVVTP